MSKTINLTRNEVALVDDDDFDKLKIYKWHIAKSKYGKCYAVKSDIHHGKIMMHRFILSAPPDLMVDHINGNGLDNRKENLRLCTATQNQRNRDKTKQNKSGYKGVSFHQEKRKFIAQIQVNEISIYIGQYDDAKEAAKAYDEAAKKYFGEFARTNF